ncbi:MAG: serine/threonine protein kinase [Kofleriaceae bacterium]|nr:serine/threonine protein kinase [Kofleriaceae bacterium]
MTSGPCPDPAELVPIADGAIDPFTRARVAEHLAGCARCRQVCSELVRGRAAADEGGANRLGRYLLGEPLGTGAMGVVFRAHDPVLDRAVAIKVIDGQGLDDAARDRLLLEAKAMAQVSAPGVIACYDAGFADGDVFVAMELIEGETLRAWAARRPDWRSAVRVALDAARGLAAAHGKGLVHRDVKPDNILVRADGQAAIGDFGLARGEHSESRVRSFAHGTRAAGTPRYLAPEVRAGGAATASSDQYAFCLTLVEVLTGDTDPAALAGVPRGLQRVLARGLADEPTARWPSMVELAAQLERNARPQRRAWWIVVGAAAVALASWLALRAQPVPDPCANPPEIETAWSPLDRTQLQATLGPARWQRVDALMRQQVSEHRTLWLGVCAATDAAAVATRACLDDASESRTAVVAALGGDRELRTYIADHIYDHLQVETCRPTITAALAPPTPLAIRAPVIAARQVLLRADARSEAGDHAGAVALAQSIAWSDGLGDPTLSAERYAMLAGEYAAIDDTAAAAAALARARDLAAHGDDVRRAAMLIRLAQVTAVFQGDRDRASGLVAEAEPIVARLGNKQREAELAYVQAVIALGAVDVPAASAAAQRAYDLERAIFGEERPELALPLLIRGQIGTLASNFDAAARDYRRAVELYTAAYGRRSPSTLNARMNLATNELFAGHGERGVAEYRAIAATLDADTDPTVAADVRSGLCEALYTAGDTGAPAACRDALAAVEHAYGPRHPQVGLSARVLGEVLLAGDDDSQLAESILLLRRAAELTARLSDDEHALASFLLARALAANHEGADEIRRLLEESVPVLRKSASRSALVELVPQWYPAWRTLAAYRGASKPAK